MSTVLSQEAPPSGLRAVPAAVWAVLAVLGIATAGLTGALVMRSVDSDKAPVVQAQPAQVASLQAPTATAGTAATLPATPAQVPATAAQVQPAQAAAVQPAPKPVPKPAHKPAPAQVAQAQPQYGNPTPIETQRAAICASCGTVEAVHAIQQKGQGSGIGAVGGAVVGGLLGNQVGGGNGKTALTVLGAVGGGLAGNEVEKRYKATTVYDVQVRMEDGSVRTIRRPDAVAVGTRVTVEGGTLRVGGNSSGSSTAPRTLRTSAPAGT
jgi:outer membrane lipoprotein SlyB